MQHPLMSQRNPNGTKVQGDGEVREQKLGLPSLKSEEVQRFFLEGGGISE